MSCFLFFVPSFNLERIPLVDFDNPWIPTPKKHLQTACYAIEEAVALAHIYGLGNDGSRGHSCRSTSCSLGVLLVCVSHGRTERIP
jgi:hypothetical protein